MRKLTKLAPVVLGLPLALPLLAGPALAADGSATANLRPIPLNGSNGSGTAMVTVNGNEIEFTLAANNLADGPHAAHIHFGADARHECPNAREDKDDDGRLSTTEGAPAYGPVVVSLTKSGDTSPKSTLAVDRFESGEEIEYSRGNVEVSDAVARAIVKGQAITVVHGVEYDDERADAKSDLNPDLPASATDPALCGRLVAAPNGGAATGAGGAADTTNAALVGLGGAVLIAAAGTGALVARRARG